MAQNKKLLAAYIISVVLVAYYGYVAYLALHPQVSTGYRMYYLDQNMTDWPGHDGPKYHLGTIWGYSLDSPVIGHNRGKGWMLKNDLGTQLMAKTGKATLHFDITDPIPDEVLVQFEIADCTLGTQLLVNVDDMPERVFFDLKPGKYDFVVDGSRLSGQLVRLDFMVQGDSQDMIVLRRINLSGMKNMDEVSER